MCKKNECQGTTETEVHHELFRRGFRSLLQKYANTQSARVVEFGTHNSDNYTHVVFCSYSIL